MNGRDVRGVLGGLTTALTLLLGLWFGGLGSSQGGGGNTSADLTTLGLTVSNDGSTTTLSPPSGDTLTLESEGGDHSWVLDANGDLLPGATNSQDLGGTSNRVSQVYCQTVQASSTVQGTYHTGPDTNTDTEIYGGSSGTQEINFRANSVQALRLSNDGDSTELTIPSGDRLAITDGGSLSYHPGGLLYSSGSAIGNVGGGEDDLHTYTVPAGLLATDGDMLRVRATFTLNGGSTLTVKSHFGTDSDTQYSTSGWTGEKAFVDLEIIRTGATTQLMRWRQQYSPTPSTAVAVESYTQTLANALVLKFTGQSSSSTSSAVTQTSMSVELVPAP